MSKLKLPKRFKACFWFGICILIYLLFLIDGISLMFWVGLSFMVMVLGLFKIFIDEMLN